MWNAVTRCRYSARRREKRPDTADANTGRPAIARNRLADGRRRDLRTRRLPYRDPHTPARQAGHKRRSA